MQIASRHTRTYTAMKSKRTQHNGCLDRTFQQINTANNVIPAVDGEKGQYKFLVDSSR